MEEKISQLKLDFPNLSIQKRINPVFEFKENPEKYYYIVTGIVSNPDLRMVLRTEISIEEFREFFKKDLFIFPDFIAVKSELNVEVLLNSTSFRTNRYLDSEDDNEGELLKINIFYFNNDLNVSLNVGGEENLISEFLKFLPGGRRFKRKAIVLKIENYSKISPEGVVNDTRNIINSVLYDIEYSYGVALETINLDSLAIKFNLRKKKYNELPKETINLVYKKYIPELIQYLHLAEKVDYLPFKFICYYHIIEYFADRSAYHLVSNEVKKIMLKPDFHINTDTYVNQAINLFKKENDKHTGDKVKIERVLKQFIEREELKEALVQLELIGYFSKAVILDCAKPLKLPAINFDQDGNFYNELTKRIYSMRCSIVHSNPDFDESKAVPFSATSENLEKLRIEIEIINEIARNIIVGSKE